MIGGWIPGNADTFLKKWRPLLETYLTDVVGPLYNPPIAFKLLAIDYTEETSYQKMIEHGGLDFVCKSFGFYVPAVCLIIIS